MDNSEYAVVSLEDWNPLEEAYYNPDFNSYASGPGADLDRNLQIPCKEVEELRIFKLYVKNIPLRLTQFGLRNLFSHFGVVKSVYIGRSTFKPKYAWGLVEYDSLQSAQDAIVATNLQPPYQLEVKFATSDIEKKRLAAEKKLQEEVCVQRTQFFKEKKENTEEERPNMISMGLLPQTISLNSCNEGERSTDNIVFDYTFFNHYSEEYLCDSTHRLHSHILFNNQIRDDYLLTDNSTSLQISTPVSLLTCLSKKLDVESDIFLSVKPAYDKQSNGVFEFGNEYTNCGKCQLCGMATSNSCKNCQAWYCGTKCLLKHWPKHKMNCISSQNLSDDDDSVKNNLDFNGILSSADIQKLSNLISEETSSYSFRRHECITLFLKEGFTGLLQVRERLSSSKFVVTLVCSELPATHKVFIEVPETVAKIPFDESFIPVVGDVVSVESTQYEVGVEWPRGYIYTKGQAVLCDFGNVVKYTKTKKLPEQLCALPSLAVYCILLEYSFSKEEFENKFIQGDNEMEFVVTKCNENGTVEASFKSDINNALTGKVVFSPLTYFSHVNIHSGSKVILSAFYSCGVIYVRSVEPESVDIFEKLMQDLGVHCEIEKTLDIEPALGDFVAVQYFKDGNWYRGQLLKKQNDNFQVIFVDFGHVETVSLSQMKSLTSYLKSVPCCAIRVGLADIPPDTPLTDLALQILINLSESLEPLRIEFPNTDLSSVKLLRQDKISLSEELNTLIIPRWKKALEQGLDPTGGQVFMLDDLMNCLLVEGKEYKLRVLLLSLPKEITLCSTTSDVSKHVIHTLSSQLNEYCAALTSTSYNPRDSELCLVRLEDDGCWYRAVCLQTLFTTSQARVMFIDFGNVCIASHKNIRRFCEDFISTPAIAIMCTYEGIPYNCAEDTTKRIEELIQLNHEYTVLVKSLDKDTLYYNIDIPSVTSVLIKEQLL